MALSKQQVIRQFLLDKLGNDGGIDEVVALLQQTKAQQRTVLLAWVQARRVEVQTSLDAADTNLATAKTAMQSQITDLQTVEGQL